MLPAVVEYRGQVPGNQEGLFLGTHVRSLSRCVEGFSRYRDQPGFFIYTYLVFAPFRNLLIVIVASAHTGGVVVEQFRKAAGLAAVLFQDVLPQGRAGAHVVSGRHGIVAATA